MKLDDAILSCDTIKSYLQEICPPDRWQRFLEAGDLDFSAAMGKTNISSIVKDLENSYPPEWRMSRGGRKKK